MFLSRSSISTWDSPPKGSHLKPPASLTDMRRHVPIILAGISALTALGCSDVSVPSSSPQTGASFSVTSALRAGVTESYRLSPNGGTFTLPGGFVVNFPANSVCDPVSSAASYALGDWDAPCQTITSPLVLTVTVAAVNGRIYADFSPHIRFSPATIVTIGTNIHQSYVHSKGYSGGNHPTTLGLLFSSATGGLPVNDAAADPSLISHINLKSGWIWRRIKHFTGYNINTGEECDPSDGDPYCVQEPGDFDDGSQNNN